jgi:hypothetical protein
LINFFCSVEHTEAWRRSYPKVGGVAVTLAQAGEIGRQNWGPVLER